MFFFFRQFKKLYIIFFKMFEFELEFFENFDLFEFFKVEGGPTLSLFDIITILL